MSSLTARGASKGGICNTFDHSSATTNLQPNAKRGRVRNHVMPLTRCPSPDVQLLQGDAFAVTHCACVLQTCPCSASGCNLNGFVTDLMLMQTPPLLAPRAVNALTFA